MSSAESSYGGAVESAYGGSEPAYGGAALHGTGEGRHGRSAGAWLRPVLAVVVGASLLFLLARFVADPILSIRHITVHSDVPLSDDDVLSLSGIRAGDHWYSVSESTIEKRLETSPLVRRAQVLRVFPDTVQVTVWGRQPAAVVLASQDARTLPVLVDEDGVVYRVGVTGADLELPVVSGITAGDVAMGAALPQPARALFAELRGLRDRAPSLFALVSEVRVVSGGGVAAGLSPDRELLVYLTSARVPIRTRGALDESFVKYALMVIDLLSRQGVLQDIQELDFRSGDVVYRRGGRATAGGFGATAGGFGAVPATTPATGVVDQAADAAGAAAKGG